MHAKRNGALFSPEPLAAHPNGLSIWKLPKGIGIKSSSQPSDTRYLMFQIILEKREKNISESDGSNGDGLAGAYNRAASHHLIQNARPHSWSPEASHGRVHRRNAVLRSFC